MTFWIHLENQLKAHKPQASPASTQTHKPTDSAGHSQVCLHTHTYSDKAPRSKAKAFLQLSKVRWSILHCFYLPGLLSYPLQRRWTQAWWGMLQKHTNTQLPIRWIYKCDWHSFTVWNPLFPPRIYYTVLSLYKHATLNANSGVTLHVFLCFASGFLTFRTTLDFHLASALDILKFLLQYLWGWERRKCSEEN